MTETWVKERKDGTIPFTYPSCCPIDLETGRVMVGLTYIGEPDGEIVGEFWYEKGRIRVELYPQYQSSTPSVKEEE